MYLHEGDSPPAECPVCGALASEFSPLEEDEDKEEDGPE